MPASDRTQQLPASHPGAVVGIEGCAAIITLDRPEALNALSAAMRRVFAPCYDRWSRDPKVYGVVMRSTSPRAFCAGGDIRELAQWVRDDRGEAIRTTVEELAHNWKLECFTKPHVPLINGVVMGSGVGLTQYGTHVVAGEGYAFAMPEVGIGWYPDVGVARTLGRMPDQVGMYLGLTGRRIGRADAVQLGLVSHCIDARGFDDILAGMREADPIDPILDRLHVDPGPAPLDRHRPTIARCFSAATVEEMLARLGQVSGEEAEWARAVAAEIATRSPTSLKVTQRLIRTVAPLTLDAALRTEYRVALRMFDGPDFLEGVRALLIDKDGRPRWQPATLADVSDTLVEEHFHAPASGDLVLPPRPDLPRSHI